MEYFLENLSIYSPRKVPHIRQGWFSYFMDRRIGEEGGIEVMHAIGREANLGGSILPALNKSLGIWA